MASDTSFAGKLFSVDEHHRTNIRVLEGTSNQRSESLLELIVFVDERSTLKVQGMVQSCCEFLLLCSNIAVFNGQISLKRSSHSS